MNKFRNVVFVLFAVCVITSVLFLNQNSNDKDKYYHDVTPVNYESDSFSYASIIREEQRFIFSSFYGVDTMYTYRGDSLDVTIDIDISMECGGLKVIMINNAGEVVNLSKGLNRVSINNMDKIKIVGNKASGVISMSIIQDESFEIMSIDIENNK